MFKAFEKCTVTSKSVHKLALQKKNYLAIKLITKSSSLKPTQIQILQRERLRNSAEEEIGLLKAREPSCLNKYFCSKLRRDIRDSI